MTELSNDHTKTVTIISTSVIDGALSLREKAVDVLTEAA